MMTIPELKIIETPGGEISYRENGSGPILLLMHGIGGNSRSWRSQLDTLSNNFRVIAWDAPAYGKSCLLYTSPSPRDRQKSRMPSSA